VQKLLKEPLLAFLVLGGLTFALFQQVAGDNRPESSDIVVSKGRIQAMVQRFEKTWRHPPSDKELNGLIQSYVHDEVLYREALAMGLGRDDALVKRRLGQKLEFISEDIASLHQPSDAELQAYLSAHHEDYQQPPLFSFRQIYFDSSGRGQMARADAEKLLENLQQHDADVTDLGDPLRIDKAFHQISTRDVMRIFGNRFLRSLRQMPIGSWQGPVDSGYGLHLVRIDERMDAPLPKLEDVREQVIRDWSSEKRRQASQALYENLRKRYTVIVEDSVQSSL